MKQIFTILIFIIFELTACSQRAVTGKQFQLIGKITGKVQLTPGCGIIAWGTVIEFEVIELTGMSYSNKEIGIIFTCPELSHTSFEKGKTYQIVFSDKNQAQFAWTIPNKDLLKKNGLSFDPYSISIKRIQ